MPFANALGALLGGITEETTKIRQEREHKKQADLQLTMSVLQNIVDNPQITNPVLKEEASTAIRDTLFQHLFPDNYKSKPGKLHKLVEQFVGQNSNVSPSVGRMLQGEGRGEGAGRGHATSPVGGLPPPPQAQAQGQPMPQSPQQALQPPQRTASGFVDPVEMQAYQAQQAEQHEARKREAESAIKMKEEAAGHKVEYEGKTIDDRLLPSIVAGINARKPDIITHARTTPEGHEVLTLIDKNTQSVVGTVDTGMVSAGVKSQYNLWYDAYVREHGNPPDTKEQERKQKELAQEGSDMILSRGLALINAREDTSKDLADRRTARAEVAKSFEPLREGISRFNVMDKLFKGINKSKAPGADDMVLLSNHIAMTFGDVKGARTGRDLIEAHLKARDMPDEMEVAAKKLIIGGQLSQAQRATFLELAKDKLDEMKASFQRTKLLWGYEPPGNDAFFKVEGAPYNAGGGTSGSGGLSREDFDTWLKEQSTGAKE